MSPRMPRGGFKWVGLDVARDGIAIAVLDGRDELPRIDKITNTDAAVRRLVTRLGDPARLRVCYEAGPTGYELHRLLTSMAVHCEVVAPSMVPVAQGDRVKTDRRDARRLVRLFRAGELVAIRVPTRDEEGCRDLCRLRVAAVGDRRRARQRVASFLLRRNLVYRDGNPWTQAHARWLRSIRFDDRGAEVAFGQLLATVDERERRVAAIEADLAWFFERGLFATEASRLAAYRGIDGISALTLASEVCDWRRFPTASRFMGFVGLVPSEDSTGARERRGAITKAGNRHVRHVLVEAAWAYQHPPRVGAGLHRRHEGLPDDVVARSWAAQVRLCGRYRRLAARKDRRTVVATAVARELAGFLWAEMRAA